MVKLKTLFQPQRAVFSYQEMLTLIGLAALAALVISIFPIVDYPFRLMLTIVHELGHGLMALLTGGEFHSFEIAADGSGLAYTAGGWRLLVIPAGYLGVACFAAVLIRLGRSHRWSRLALGIIGLAMLALSLWFARPGSLTFQSILNSGLTIVFGLLFGVVFLRLAFNAPPATIVFVTHLVAIKAGLTAFSDIFSLIGLAALSDVPRTDAQSMANLTFIPAVVWAFVWIALAVALIGWAIKVTWLNGSRG